MPIPGSVSTSEGDFSIRLIPNEKQNILQKTYTKWFDYDKIKNRLNIRKRCAGDYLTINEALSKKSLKEYMIQEKIPKEERYNIWLLAEESHILWVIGGRISAQYKIGPNTKHILQVQLKGGTKWENT